MAPRRTKSSGPPPPANTLVLDNGAYTIKAGLVGADTETPAPNIIPNCLARDRDKKVYIGSQLSSCKDFSEILFRRPVEKGYLVNWEAEKEIWEHEFFDPKASLHCDPAETGLILTEAPNALPALQTNCDQVAFEEFGFARYLRVAGRLTPPDFLSTRLTSPAPTLNAYTDIQSIFKSPPRDPASTPTLPAEILMLIDSGYSHTTIAPLLLGHPIQSAIRRLDVGGKLLTNYLTRLLSLRQYDMRNDTYLVNEIKEATCYVSKDLKADMERTWKGPKGDRRPVYETADGIAKDYVLPDYHGRAKGYVRDHDPKAATKLKEMVKGKAMGASEDVLTLRNERFTVPELLFSPTDIGLRQSGIAQQVMDSLSSLPMGLWPGFLANIVVVGGNSKIEGFVFRLQAEIRSLAPAECIVRVARPADPVVNTWQGGANLAKDEEALGRLSVTRQEYEEYGAGWVARKFGGR
jgi:actin-related protein 6